MSSPTFRPIPAGSGTGDMTKAVYDTDDDGTVDAADSVPWSGVTDPPTTFAPTTHATNHQSGGSDAIKLDDLATPDDNTDLNASTDRHGLLPKLGGGTTNFLRADGTWAAPTGGSSGGGITWNEVTGTTQTAAADNGYICNNAALVTVTLPSTCALGKTIRVAGKGAGGWKIAQNAGQQIHFGDQNTTSGTAGYLAAQTQYDSIELLCITANTTFNVISVVGNITVV